MIVFGKQELCTNMLLRNVEISATSVSVNKQ